VAFVVAALWTLVSVMILRFYGGDVGAAVPDSSRDAANRGIVDWIVDRIVDRIARHSDDRG
jgi:hypothetical protein